MLRGGNVKSPITPPICRSIGYPVAIINKSGLFILQMNSPHVANRGVCAFKTTGNNNPKATAKAPPVSMISVSCH
jgi:hypothetical protein